MRNKERGITLIALVITIIILLILAGVAINMALGDNGLFRKAREAVNTWKTAEEDEQTKLNNLYGFLDDNTNSNKIRVQYKKMPIRAGEDVIAVQIYLEVLGIPNEIELKSEDDYFASMRKMLNGKSEWEKEQILDRLMEQNESALWNGYTNHYGLMNHYGTSNLSELADRVLGGSYLQYYGVEDKADAVIMHYMENTGAPYYRKEEQEEKEFYKLTEDGKIEKQLSRQEFYRSVQDLLKDKTEEQKEEILDSSIRYFVENNNYNGSIKTLEDLYNWYEVTNLTELANKIANTQEAEEHRIRYC